MNVENYIKTKEVYSC